MKKVFPLAGNGGFSLLLILLFLSAPELLQSQEKGKNDISSLLQIKMESKNRNVKDGIVKEIREIRFDPSGITRFAESPPEKRKKNLRKSEKNKLKRFTVTPPDSLAAIWEKKISGTVIQWKVHHAAGGMISLPDSFLSNDNSLWVFLEVHGGGENPYGTRLVFLNTHTWKVVFAKDYPEFYAVKGVFLEDKILLFCKGQKYRDTKDAFIILDPATGEILNTIPLPFSVGRLEGRGGLLAVSEKNSGKIYLYRLSGDKLLLRKSWNTPCVNPALFLSSDGKTLFTAGKDLFQEFSLDNSESREKLPLSLPFPPAKIFMPGHKLVILLPGNDSPGNDGFLLREGVLSPMGGVSGGEAFPGLEKNRFFMLLAKKGTFADYRLPSCTLERSIPTADLRPRTNGRLHFARHIPHASCIGILDSNGVFYLIFPDYAGKKFQKLIIFQ